MIFRFSFFITTDPKPHKCPRCNNQTAKVHDYRIQKIKDIPFQGKSCTLHLKKRRYHCPNCGKHFYESYDFVSRYMNRTQRLTKFIAHSFHSVITIKEASDKANVSTHTVYKVLGTLNNSSDRIGEAISIDEFKGNAGTEKYQTIVVDPIKHKVLDILYSRKSACLVEYFKSLDKSKRMNVKYWLYKKCWGWQVLLSTFFIEPFFKVLYQMLNSSIPEFSTSRSHSLNKVLCFE